MSIAPFWLLALVFTAIICLMIVWRSRSATDESVNRLARLVGARRAWGESDDSLRRRSLALSRWPYEQQAPVVASYVRAWTRIRPRHR